MPVAQNGDDQPLQAKWRLIRDARQPVSDNDCIHNWHCLLRQLENKSERAPLQTMLSAPQWTALQILEEWWFDDGEHRETVARDRRVIEEYRKPDHSYPEHDRYCASIVLLWRAEITIYHEAADCHAEVLLGKEWDIMCRHLRQSAASVAAEYRLAHRSLRFLRKFFEQPGFRTIKKFTQPEDIDLGRFWTKDSIPALVNACEWLQLPSGDDRAYPYYLWDLEGQCTVEVSSFSTCPDYAVISHTWGRWRIKSQSVNIPGVPWPIPCNTIFDVTDLPAILSKFPVPIRYLWFDLVCIPQRDASEALAAVARYELAKQASIFNSAKCAIVWLNHIDDWNGLRNTIHWVCLRYFRNNPAVADQIADLLPRVAALSQQQTQLAIKSEPKTLDTVKPIEEGSPTKKEPEGSADEGLWEPCGWLTSLWTLQELCLRPRMWLCCSDWSVFSIDRRPIALDEILTLTSGQVLSRKNEEDRRAPRGVTQLYETLKDANLSLPWRLSRMSILITGNRRYCSGRRAEAIMSAIGSTLWYREKNERPQRKEDEASPGQPYPMSFLLETRQAVGAAFFCTSEWFEEDETPANQISATLLPFTRLHSHCVSMIPDNTQQPIEDHSSVANWVIEENGSVRIKQVGIIASWPQSQDASPAPRIEASIFAYNAKDNLEWGSGRLDLVSWLGTFRPDAEKHAICLLRQTGGVWGVFLERIPDLEPSQPSRFFKFGNFKIPTSSVETFDIPPTTEVDWIVA